MQLFCKLQKSLKNGFYVDYFFKKFIYYFYLKIIANGFYYLIDKYLADKLIFTLKIGTNYLRILSLFLTKVTTISLIKIMLLITLQIFCIIYF